MGLPDGITEFLLTMVMLTTVVTVITEICLRIARKRKKNLVEVMKLLDKELAGGALRLEKKERWDFFVRVVNNPAAPGAERLTSRIKDMPLEKCLAELGCEKTAGKTLLMRFFLLIKHSIRDRTRDGFYEKVSLEHVLRCLVETDSLKHISSLKSMGVKAELNRLARKYEEFDSAVSAAFKKHSLVLSISIGILLAISSNIDVLRLFDAYRMAPEPTLSKNERPKKSIPIGKEGRGEQNSVETNKQGKPPGSEQKEVENPRQNLNRLTELGVPMGWGLYPNCPHGVDVENRWMGSPRCKAAADIPKKVSSASGSFILNVYKTARQDWVGFLRWLFTIIGTGLLIGLGVPVWFRVAMLLSQLRKGRQSEAASSEYLLGLNNANGDPEKRKKIVENVIFDAIEEASARNPKNEGVEKEMGAI